MKTFKLQIAAPDGMRYDGESTQLSVRGIAGELAVLAGHVPFVTALVPGEVRVYLESGEIKKGQCGGGMLMVAKDCTRVMASDFTWKE